MEDPKSVDKVAADKAPELHRRDVLARLGRAAGYAAPVSVALLSMKASATSVV
jgi:hypothetical protein